MDLFNKKLSMDEAIQLDSIIDNGNYDPHLVLYASMMDKPEFQASNEQTNAILDHLAGSNRKTVQTDQIEPNIDNNKMDNNNVENKKETKRYITLPNATIEKHKHKFKQAQIGSNNETTKSRKRGK